MDWDRYRNFLISNIQGARPVKGGQEINCRCRNCPDSSDPRSAHMYISVPTNNTDPSYYNCFKCGYSGIVTHKSLIAWGIFDPEIADDITKHNASISKLPRNNKYFNSYTYHIRNTYTTMDRKSELKRRYIVERLGVDLNFADLKALKICVNLLDLLKENNIRNFSRDTSIINDLDREFIGFISMDNAYLNMRRTCSEGRVYKSIDKRYVNYKLFNKFNTEERFYTIPTKVDLNKPDRLKVNIAEGPFDILSVYLNLRNKEEGIYTAIGGNNPVSVLLYFLSVLKLPYIELHYYVDNDKFGKTERIRYLMNLLPDKFPVYIHRNVYENEKDFGVPVNRIKESVMRL